ncbi:MAG: DUF885 domain-containing protein [Methanobacteriota archaeon]|nr:MAG: DUF885 domain-containing protein [Euryarchaeota archaeon]
MNLPQRRGASTCANVFLRGRHPPAGERTTARGSTALAKIAKEVLRSRWDFHPTVAAGSGLHRYDGRLPHYGPAALRRRVAQIDRQLKALDAVGRRGDLPAAAALELGVLRGMLLSERFDLADLREPNTLPSYFLYRLSIVGYVMRNYAPLDRRLRAVARMQGQVPRFLRELRAATQPRLSETYYEMGEMAARGMIDAYERELPEHLAKASPAVRRLVERTNAAAVNDLKILEHEFETRYKPRARKTFAIGRRKYERMIRSEHLAPIPIERLLEAGERDLAANRAQFLEAARKIDPAKAPQQVVEDISRDHPAADSLIEDTRRMLEEIRQYVIDRDIVSVPSEERAQAIETPRFYRFATAAMNSPGAFENVAKEAYYYVTPVEESWSAEKREEWLRHLNYTSLRNISVHECYPGHYVHMLHRKRVTSTVLRAYFSYAFTEGWAHYCEEMMVEQGFGDGRLRLAQLQDALLRNCRYISSIKMHTAGWSWGDATRFFMENAFLDQLPAEREAKRGTWDPGYLNYTLGKLMIKKLRADWLDRHSGASLREFHDTLLGLGAPPLGVAREHLLGPGAGPAL